MMGGRSWDDWIEEYSHAHEHPINKLTHSFGIPMIVLSILLIPVCFFVSNLWMVRRAIYCQPDGTRSLVTGAVPVIPIHFRMSTRILDMAVMLPVQPR